MLLQNEEETTEFGRSLGRKLKIGDIVALHGELGTGKTTLAKGIIETLTSTSKEEVQSPTFTYLHTYGTAPLICHFDLYRLKDQKAFIALGLLDHFENKNICLVEWAERIAPLLPHTTIHVELSQTEDGKRNVYVR